MSTIDKTKLGKLFGRVSSGNQTALEIMCDNRDVSIGEVFLIYSSRDDHESIFLFRVLELQNYIRNIDRMDGIAGTLIVEQDAYLSDIEHNMLLSVGGRMLGYADYDFETKKWMFKAPRRLPAHLAEVYRAEPGEVDAFVSEIIGDQIAGEIYVGDLQVGEEALDVPVYIPSEFLPMHVAIFGATGSGKSNLMMVLIKSLMDNNMAVQRGSGDGTTVSAFCIDPHDEFAKGVDTYGIQSIVDAMDSDTRKQVIGDYYYLTTHKNATPREIKRYTREIRILWSEIQPRDLYSIMDFSPQMSAFIDSVYSSSHETWVSDILAMDESMSPAPAGTLHAVQRRLSFLERSSIFIDQGVSILPDIYIAMETGRVLVVNTSLMSDMEQFLLTTIVTRTLSDMRRALKSSGTLGNLDTQAQARLPHSFYSKIKQHARGFYGHGGTQDNTPVKSPRELPAILITVEEAPSILNPELMKGRSVFKDISRQGRKFGIGLLVVSQQVSVLDNVILSQTNTQINLRLGNEREIQSSIDNASVNISGFEQEFRVMSRGEAMITASYRDMPLPVRIPLFDDIFEHDKHHYKKKNARAKEVHNI
ncbi:MAG: ATP-binding protein [Candidatus Thorarchaeota archaeon]